MDIFIDPKNLSYDDDIECYVVNSDTIVHSDNVSAPDIFKFIKGLIKNTELDYTEWAELLKIACKGVKSAVEFESYEVCMLNAVDKLMTRVKDY